MVAYESVLEVCFIGNSLPQQKTAIEVRVPELGVREQTPTDVNVLRS